MDAGPHPWLGAGTNTLGDILGAVRGRHLCAVAAVQFFKLIGRTPLGESNPTAQEFCALMWEAAGGKVSDAVKCGDMVDAAAWERHLQEARNQGTRGDYQRSVTSMRHHQ